MGPTFWDPSAIGIYKALNNRVISEFKVTLKRFIVFGTKVKLGLWFEAHRFCTKVELGLWFEAKQSHVSIQACMDVDWDIAVIARQAIGGIQA